MLILDKRDLQKTIRIENQEIEIRTDFRTWIQFSCIVSDKYIDENYKIPMLFDLVIPNYELYMENVDSLELLKGILDFYKCNKPDKPEKKPNKKVGFLFDYDMDLIFAAFMQQYGINLLRNNMHWWEFKALLNGLNDDTKFVQVVGYRTADLSKIKDKKERARMKELQDYYAIQEQGDPFQRTQEEIEAELFESLGIPKE